jgi:two-component system response regulator QseB
MRILLVEDDELLGSGVSDALEFARHAHEWVRDGKLALALAQDGDFDLIILDLGLPGMDGFEVLRRLREGGSQTAVLILSARDGARDRVAGLNLGADDYLIKPFELDELLARLNALERRRMGVASNRISLGRLSLDLSTHTVSLDGQEVTMLRREFMLLRKLLELPSQILSRGQLEAAVYGFEGDIESNSIDVHVFHLRKKLYPEVIKTIRGVGYQLDPALKDNQPNEVKQT